jgi:MYXO-CTERM domain-containing protein
MASRPLVRFAALTSLTLALLLPWGAAQAGDPRLDASAAERGIAAGELTIGERRTGSAAQAPIRAELRSLRLHGLPVRGGFETVWRPGEVHERVIASRYPSAPPQRLPNDATIDLVDARALLAPSLRADQLVDPERITGELVYLLIVDRPVLAWELTTPMSLAAPEPTRERVWISATTGRELERESLLFNANETEVYRFNPAHTPDPILVTLANIDPEQAWSEDADPTHVNLNGTRLRTFACIDVEDGPYAPWWKEGECYPTQQVVADENGDFFVPLPDIGLLADNIDPVDLYAELSMYYHAETFFEFMAQLGITDFPCEMSNMVSNFHWLEPAPGYPDLEFGPYNNAYYSGSCELEDGPTMLFGQGSAVDFGYDGDVVYHELGHGIVQLLTPGGLTSSNKRSDGLLRDARAINEAIADYHAMMVTDRPEMADYVGFYWADLDRGWIRNAENELQCPRDMTGEEHYDSEPFAAGLWAARRRIGGEKLDPVVLASLPLLPPDVTIEQASAALLEVAAAERDAGTWTAQEYDELERTLAGRNLLDCPRVTDGAVEPKDGRFLYVRGRSTSVTPFWPGPLQLSHVIPEGSDNMLLSFEVSGQGNSAGQPTDDDVDMRVLIKRGGSPVTFEYALGSLGHAEGEEEDIDEITVVSGDWDVEFEPSLLSGRRREVFVRGLEPGEIVHIAFANRAKPNAVIREIFLGSVPSGDLDHGSPNDLDDGPIDTRLDDGCACTSAGRSAKGGHGLALGLLLLAALRRRRFRSSRS